MAFLGVGSILERDLLSVVGPTESQAVDPLTVEAPIDLMIVDLLALGWRDSRGTLVTARLPARAAGSL